MATAELLACRVEVFIGGGSNLEQPEQQLRSAFRALQALPESGELRCSSLYRTPPMGPPAQPDFLNVVFRMVTRLAPQRLLQALQAIEHAQGRVRGERWGARTLDLDLLLFGDLVLQTPDLQIPHPGIAHRAFVLYPLLDIAPDLSVPGLGKVAALIADISTEGLVKVGNFC